MHDQRCLFSDYVNPIFRQQYGIQEMVWFPASLCTSRYYLLYLAGSMHMCFQAS